MPPSSLGCSQDHCISNAPHWYVVGTKGCLTAEDVNGPIRVQTEDMGSPETLEPIREIDQLYENLIDSCFGIAEPNVTPAQLRASMGLIDAIFKSSRTGGLVTV